MISGKYVDKFRLVFLLVILYTLCINVGKAICAEEIDLDNITAEEILKVVNEKYEKSNSKIPFYYQVVLDNWKGIESGNSKVNELKNQTRAAIEKGEFEEAHKLIAQGLELERKEFESQTEPSDASRKSIIDTLNIKATLHKAIPEYKLTEESYREALGYCPGSEKKLRAEELRYLGEILFERAKFEEANKVLNEALKLAESEYGENHAKTAEVLNVMAFLYCITYDLKKAETTTKSSVATAEASYGKDNTNILYHLCPLEYLAILTDNTKDMKAIAGRYFSIIKESETVNRRDLINYLNLQISLYFDLKNFDEAEDLCRRSLEMAKETYGALHPEIDFSLGNMERYCMEADNFIEAQNYANTNLQIHGKYHSTDHPSFADSLCGMGIIYYHYEWNTLAEATFKRSLEITRNSFGDDHIFVWNTKIWLSRVYTDDFRTDEAEKLIKEVLDAAEKSYIKVNNIIALCHGDLGRIYMYADKNSLAKKHITKALEVNSGYLPEDDLNIAYNLLDLAEINWQMDDFDEGITNIKRSIAILIKNHSKLKNTYTLEYATTFYAEVMEESGKSYNKAAKEVIAMAPELIKEEWFDYRREQKEQIIDEF